MLSAHEQAWIADVIAAGSEDGPELERAVLALKASPLVDGVERLRDGSGLYATLWCRSSHPRRNSEQRQFTQVRTTLAQCATSLLELINKNHGAHLETAEAARAAAAVEAAAAAGPSAPTDAFAAMAAARHVQPAQEAANLADQRAAEARVAQKALEAQLEAANKAVEAAESEAQRLEEEVRQGRSNCAPLVLGRPLSFSRRVFACARARASPAPSRMRKSDAISPL
jgi:hypothetical protein